MNQDNGRKHDDYVTAYDAAQRRSARLAAEAITAHQQADLYVAQGRALYQIKELARAGFLLLPEATVEKFEQLWRAAFQVEVQGQKGNKK